MQIYCLLIAVLVTVLLAPGMANLSYDDDPKNIFRFDGQEFRDYQALIDHFPHSESDFVIIIPGEVFTAASLNSVLSLSDDLIVNKVTRQVLSLANTPLVQNHLVDPFTDEYLTEIDADLAAQIAADHQQDQQHSRFFVADQADAQVIVVSGDPAQLMTTRQNRDFMRAIGAALEQAFAPQSVEYLIGGSPAMRVSIQQQLQTDTLYINILATIIAMAVAIGLFRSIRILIAISIGPAIGVVWALGLMGWLGDKITVFTSVLVPLLFVLGYTNAAHIIFAALRNTSIESRWHKSWHALLSVGLACFLSALTTCIAFSTLELSGSALIAQFGFYSALGTLFTFAAVVMLTPVTVAMLGITDLPNTERIIQFAARPLHAVCDWVSRRQRQLAAAAVMICLVLFALSFKNVPDYQFRENFTAGNQFYRAIEIGDEKFSGTFGANIVLDWSDSQLDDLGRLFALDAKVRAVVSDVFATERVLSLGSLLGEVVSTRIKTLAELQAAVPAEALERQFSSAASQALVSLPVPDMGAQALVPKFDELRRQLTGLSVQFPEFKLTLTGLSPLGMYASTINIREMALSLMAALAAIFLVIVISLRSLRLGLICMVPNIIPIAGVAALQVISGTPLYYTTVLVFTICLGIAVDDTVHFTLRYRREYLASGSTRTALNNSVRHIGMVLVFTTSVFGAAFFSLTFSSIGVVKIMGLLSFIALGLALLADLVLLPAMLASRFGQRALGRV